MFKISKSTHQKILGLQNILAEKILGRQNILAEKIPILQNILMVPKNDRTYSEYFDWSENSAGSEISGSKYSDDGGSTGIRIHIFTLVSISGHRYANDMVKSMLER